MDEALRLNPSEPIIRAYHALALWTFGEPEAALAELSIARRLSPNDSNVWFVLHAEAMILSMSDRFEESIIAAEKAIDERAGATLGHMGLIFSLAALGRAEDAKSAFQRATKAVPGFSPRLIIMGVPDEGLRENILDACRRAGWDG